MNNNKQLAKNLVNYSCRLKKGEKILIEAGVGSEDLVKEIIKEVYSVGGYPFVRLTDGQINRELMLGMDKNLASLTAKYNELLVKEIDAHILISVPDNVFETASVPSENKEAYIKYYTKPIRYDIIVKQKKWVLLNYPTKAYAQSAGMSTSEFEEFYYKVCTLDYSKMNKAMDSLKRLMEKTDKVRIVAPNTDLTFSIKGIPAIKCAGEMNIPDGEIYTAPVKNSINGTITYNTASMYRGVKFENIRLTFKDGKIIDSYSSLNNEKLTEILNTDEGARYVGEFAIGVNPYITKPMLDILFDEKISGSIHLTPGACYDEAPNGNDSAVHYDLVLIQTKEFGGGEIYFDDVLIRKDGLFVLEELKCLNPENLK